MEDIYTIQVKTKPDTRNLYPSERRYSASTVSGLAWVHIALATTSFLLACLALVNPNSEIKRLKLQDTTQTNIEKLNLTEIADNSTVTTSESSDNNYILVLAPGLITICALSAGIASIMASSRWYVDRNITWLFFVSILSTILSLTAFVLVTVWFATTSEHDQLADFYTDKVPFKSVIVIKHTDVIDRNESHYLIANNKIGDEHTTNSFTKKVLSINILIAAFLELLWSILSVKISYKGMRNNYKEDSNERPGNCISVITKIKGNAKKLPRNGKLIPPKPDLIAHYPNNKNIKRIFLAQSDNGFYLKNQNDKNKHTDTSSEFYKERMINYLNRCASFEGVSNPDCGTPSVQSEAALNAIPEITSAEVDPPETPDPPKRATLTPLSWGDIPEHTVYNQNNINFDKIFSFGGKKTEDVSEKQNTENCDEVSENVKNNN